MAEEKRRHPRTGSHNLVSYACRDEKGQAAGGGIGRALNVSEGGILLETRSPMAPSWSVSLTVALEDELMDIRGKIAYSNRRSDGKYETGIQFLESDEKKVRLLRQFVTIPDSDSTG
jgi:hypothetical protein